MISRIDLGNATENDLVGLSAACQKATFGVDQTDILDESYRKAGKMDLSKFATRLDVVTSGLLAAIRPDILQGQDADTNKTLSAELYKLNVYGPGSFFKAHKDTPRGETMIGSLVVVFPTAHAGGALTLEHGGTVWTFDSAAELAATTHTPALAYVSFYSDVTHAVEPVHSGHRVTLTYNLFLRDDTPNPAHGLRIVPDPERAFEDLLRTLLADSAFLPAGGFLAYGLTHQYPMPTEPEIEWVNGRRTLPTGRLGPVLRLLKGSDARIRTVSERVGLETYVKMLYDSGENYDGEITGHDVLVDDVLNTDHVYNYEGGELQAEIEKMGTILERDEEREKDVRERNAQRAIKIGRPYWPAQEPKQESVESAPVHWVTKITELNRVCSHYIRYGNDASMGHVYGNAALFVRVPAFNDGVCAATVSE
ncbi:hypothetical protein B0H14DRAFT_2687088 [Mycena olivaceomarginata]|nr:hypothetical protein B0H14DRAFT_2687088 [Mycena olivaceomarginata]